MSKNQKEIVAKLDVLQDKCIDNFEDRFSEYLLNDLKETGKVVGLIDTLDTYLYWVECADEVNVLINTLLEISEDGVDELIKRAITIKRVIDGELIKVKPNDVPGIYKDLNLDYYGDKHNGHIIPLKFDGEDKAGFVSRFYQCLIHRNWINTDIETFKSNFFMSDISLPVNWMFEQKVLILLIKRLINAGVIVETLRRPKDLIHQHFTIKGRLISIDSISSTYSDINDNPFVEDFIKELLPSN